MYIYVLDHLATILVVVFVVIVVGTRSRVLMYPAPSVCPSVRQQQKFSYFPSLVFSDFGPPRLRTFGRHISSPMIDVSEHVRAPLNQ